MNPVKLFITLLMLSIIMVSCSKTELFQEENATLRTNVETVQDDMIIYVNQDLMAEADASISPLPGQKIVYLTDAEYNAKMLTSETVPSSAKACNATFSNSYWSGKVTLSSLVNTYATASGTISPFNPGNIGMRVDAVLYRNGKAVANGSTDYFTSGTKTVPLNFSGSRNYNWTIKATNLLYQGGYGSQYLQNSPRTCKGLSSILP